MGACVAEIQAQNMLNSVCVFVFVFSSEFVFEIVFVHQECNMMQSSLGGAKRA